MVKNIFLPYVSFVSCTFQMLAKGLEHLFGSLDMSAISNFKFIPLDTSYASCSISPSHLRTKCEFIACHGVSTRISNFLFYLIQTIHDNFIRGSVKTRRLNIFKLNCQQLSPVSVWLKNNFVTSEHSSSLHLLNYLKLYSPVSAGQRLMNLIWLKYDTWLTCSRFSPGLPGAAFPKGEIKATSDYTFSSPLPFYVNIRLIIARIKHLDLSNIDCFIISSTNGTPAQTCLLRFFSFKEVLREIKNFELTHLV